MADTVIRGNPLRRTPTWVGLLIVLGLALLPAPLSGLAKGSLATLGTVALSWAAVAALR